MTTRGWLASGLLAAAVIGGYLGLLPLLSSLASGPSWPQPIATREAAVAVTAGAEPASAPGVETPQPEPDVVANGQGDGQSSGSKGESGGSKSTAEVRVSVAGSLNRVQKPHRTTTPNGGAQVQGNGGGNGSQSSSGSQSSNGSQAGNGGSNAGGNGGSTQTPPTAPPSLDGVGPGDLAGGSGAPSGDDDAVTAGG